MDFQFSRLSRRFYASLSCFTLMLFCAVCRADEGSVQVFDLNTATLPVEVSGKSDRYTFDYTDETLGLDAFLRFGNRLFFRFDEQISPNQRQSRLMAHNAETGTTVEIRSGNGKPFSSFELHGVHDGALFFYGAEDNSPFGTYGLWRLKEQSRVPELVLVYNDTRASQMSSNDGHIYILALNNTPGKLSLWRSDDNAQMQLVSDDIPDRGSFLQDISVLASEDYLYLYFSNDLLRIDLRTKEMVLKDNISVGAYSMRLFEDNLCFTRYLDAQRHIACMNGFQQALAVPGTENVYDRFLVDDNALIFAKIDDQAQLTLHRYRDGEVTDLPMDDAQIEAFDARYPFFADLHLVDNVLYGLGKQQLFSYDLAQQQLNILLDFSGRTVLGPWRRQLLKSEQGKLVFELFAPTDDVSQGYQRFELDPTTNRIDMTIDGSELFYAAQVIDDVAYGWAADAAAQTTLVRYDLQTGTSRALSDLNSVTQNASPRGFHVHNDTLFFIANAQSNSQSNGQSTHRLWRVEKGADAPEAFLDISLPGDVEQDVDLIGAGDSLYLLSNGGGSQMSLHELNLSGRWQLPIASFEASEFPSIVIAPQLIAHQGNVYFTANNGSSGFELWSYAPQERIVYQAADIADGEASAYPKDYVVYQNSLVFSAETGGDGTELWRFEVTTGLVEQVASLQPGHIGSDPGGFVLLNDGLLFSAQVGANGGYETRKLTSFESELTHPLPALSHIIQSYSFAGQHLLLSATYDTDSEFARDDEPTKFYESCSWWLYDESGDALERLNHIETPLLRPGYCASQASMVLFNDKAFFAAQPGGNDTGTLLKVWDRYTGTGDAGADQQTADSRGERFYPEQVTAFDGALWMSGIAEVDGVKTGRELIRYTDTRPVIQQGDVAALTTQQGNESESLTLQATDADSVTVEWQVLSEPENGDVVLDVNGLQASLRYAPRQGFEGQDEAMIQVSDGTHTDAIVVQFTVEPSTQTPSPSPTPPAPAPEPTPSPGAGSSSGGGSVPLWWIMSMHVLCALRYQRRARSYSR